LERKGKQRKKTENEEYKYDGQKKNRREERIYMGRIKRRAKLNRNLERL
jgi:hypothetical protein